MGRREPCHHRVRISPHLPMRAQDGGFLVAFNVLDWITLAFLAIMFLRGLLRGLLTAVIALAGTVASAAVAWFTAPQATAWMQVHWHLGDRLAHDLATAFAGTSLGNFFTGDTTLSQMGVTRLLYAMQSLPWPEPVKQSVVQALGRMAHSSAQETVQQFLVQFIIEDLVFLIILALVYLLIVRLVARPLTRVADAVPVAGLFNRLLGGILFAAVGAVVATLVFDGFWFVAAFTPNASWTAIVSHSQLAAFFPQEAARVVAWLSTS